MKNNVNFAIFCALGFFNSVIARDYVIYAFNRFLNQSIDPCDDYYRYFCPVGREFKLVQHVMNDVDLLQAEALKLTFFETEIKHDIQNLIENRGQIYSNSEIFIDHIYKTLRDHFEQLCLNNKNSTLFLETLTELALSPEKFRNLKDLAKDNDCIRTTQLFNEFVIFPPDNIYRMETNYDILEVITVEVIMYADEKIIKAMYEIRSYLKQMVSIVKQWAKETPWLYNSGTEKAFEKVIEDVEFDIEFSKTFQSRLEVFLGLEKSYLKCKNGLNMHSEIEIMLCAHNAMRKASVDFHFNGGLTYSADNLHTTIKMFYPILHALNNLNDEASKLGVVGAALGDQLGHIIIKSDYNERVYIPYFSENVRNCIQEQWNSTCEEYSDISKYPANSYTFETSGAELIGRQLAYELLKNYYGDKLHTQHPQISATYEQMFFFAQGIWLCGESQMYLSQADNSPDNIRANLIVQLPSFQTAYNCSEDSRMIRSRTEMCTILGAGAPQIKRR